MLSIPMEIMHKKVQIPNQKVCLKLFFNTKKAIPKVRRKNPEIHIVVSRLIGNK